MNSPIIQLLVLAGIAIFLILRLRSVLGTRDGFEPPREATTTAPSKRPDLEVIEGGPDRDITDHVDEDSETAKVLAAMKSDDPSFGVGDFLQGARGAYEMILMGFERGDLADLKPFLSDEVYQTFAEVVESRDKQGLTIEAEFIGVRETSLRSASYDPQSGAAEVTVRLVAELTSVVRDNAGDIVEGNPSEIKKQKDVWTFARDMSSNNPNWQLVATAE